MRVQENSKPLMAMVKENDMKKIFIVYFIVSASAIVWMGSSLKEKNDKERILADRFKSWEEIVGEIAKVRGGDAEAAYNLSLYYQYQAGDLTASYYWMLQAKKLGFPKATDDVLANFESAPLSVTIDASSDAVKESESKFDGLPPVPK